MGNSKKLSMSDSIKKYQEIKTNKNMSAKEVLKKEYPLIYSTYKEIMDEQFELFAKKHLDYGMGNVSQSRSAVSYFSIC